MGTEASSSLKRIAALATIATITSGCAGLPSAEGVTTMSLTIRSASLGGPNASINGDSEMAPGKTARASLPPSEMCQDFLIIFCAVAIPLAVPVAAIVGAVAKTSQKLPLEQAIELNRATADVTSQLNLAASFSAALETEAQHRGLALNVANPGGRILVEPRWLSWNIKPGNQAEVRMEIEVTVQIGREEGTREVTYRGRSGRVAGWIADNGQPIRQSLDEAMVGASRDVWDRILGPE